MNSISFRQFFGAPCRVLRVISVAIITSVFSLSAFGFTEGDKINTTLEGCRQATPNTIILPGTSTNGSPEGFVCEEGGVTGSYTTGNIKFWNELDLVPFRVTLTRGAQSSTPEYDFFLAADLETNNGYNGYDVITAPVVNDGLSHASCVVVSAGLQTNGPALTGGIVSSIFRLIRVAHDTGTTCVLDYTQRMALGASNISGGSLHAYQFSQETKTGNRTVPIFASNILPQELSKDMLATQDTKYTWDVSKARTPASVSFPDTCDISEPTSKPVSVRVEWKVYPGAADGKINVVTSIYAKNSASRTIAVNVEDKIFGNGDGDNPLDTAVSGDIDVPANSEIKVLEHTFEADAGVTDLYDVATATYMDDLTGVAIPGTTTATFVLNTDGNGVQAGNDKDSTAIITDTESITGDYLSYSADSTKAGSASGSFKVGGADYTLGTALDPNDPDLVWTSVSQDGAIDCQNAQDGCLVGFVEFNKTIYIDAPALFTGEKLSDTAQLLASDGFTDSFGPVNITINAGAEVSLKINKYIPDVLQGEETIACNFTVKDSGNEIVWSPVINFTAGETYNYAEKMDLAPDKYTVTEGECGGLISDVGNTKGPVDLELPNCSDDVTFNNILGAGSAVAEVNKVAEPTGLNDANVDGWTMTLKGPGTGTDGIDLVTADTDPALYETFLDPNDFLGGPFLLLEGAYTITESVKSGWEKTAESGCTFSVDYPGDSGQKFQCVFTNKQLGTIIVNKVTEPEDPQGNDEFGFVFAPPVGDPNDFTLVDDGQETFSDLSADKTYTVTENDPTSDDYDLAAIDCVETGNQNASESLVNRRATIPLDPGGTVECTFTNHKRGMVEILKLTNGLETADVHSFTLNGLSVNTSDTTPPTLVDFGGVKLIAGEQYRVCETGIGASVTSVWYGDADGDGAPETLIPFVEQVNTDAVDQATGYSRVFDPNYTQGEYTNDTRCVNFVVEPGQTKAFKIDNQSPGGDQRTIGYWKNWNNCSRGNQYAKSLINGNWVLEGVLPQTIGDLTVDTCDLGRDILDKRDVGSGKKRAGDAAYGLAAQLLAAKANVAAGAGTCTAATDAIDGGQSLLESGNFDGTGSYWKGGKNAKAQKGEATTLAGILDSYNNGLLCGAP